jgi:hypothetical protein
MASTLCFNSSEAMFARKMKEGYPAAKLAFECFFTIACALLRRALVATFFAWMATPANAQSQQLGASAMQRLAFLSGRWTCTVSGGESNGLTLDLSYSFSPNVLWMTEVSRTSEATGNDWATQIWGYDARNQKLLAFQFTESGVFTKTVDGWVDGVFLSQRDDNQATVSLKPISANTMQWIIESADHSSTIKEDCVRR